jgi:hypothetical protein
MKVSKHLAMVLAFGSMTAYCQAQTAKTQKLTGWISDSKCHAQHDDAGCVKKCIDAGATAVFVDWKNKIWTIDNPDSVQKYYADKVEVQATVDSTNNSIHIDKVKQLYNTDM